MLATVLPRQLLTQLRTVVVVRSTAYSTAYSSNQRRHNITLNDRIMRVELRQPERLKYMPSPFDNDNQFLTYSYIHTLLYGFSDTTHRFDGNSKFIFVDGPPGANKDALCKDIAKAFDMKYMPACHLDGYYIDHYGRDLRALNYKLPPKLRSWDVHQFNERPKCFLTTRMQYFYFYLRFCMYIDAMEHLLNTGQGVVMHRSIYSDAVFGKTMVDMGFMPKAAYDYIEESKDNSMYHFMFPHLCIYLDQSPETIIKNITKRNINNEVGSPFFTEESLTQLNKNYKSIYLDKMTEHSHMLIYDWNDPGCHEDVIDDISDIDWTQYNKSTRRLFDWTSLWWEDQWRQKRIAFGSNADDMLQWIENTRLRDIPELFSTLKEIEIFREVIDQEPSLKYVPGWNVRMGDKVFPYNWIPNWMHLRLPFPSGHQEAYFTNPPKSKTMNESK